MYYKIRSHLTNPSPSIFEQFDTDPFKQRIFYELARLDASTRNVPEVPSNAKEIEPGIFTMDMSIYIRKDIAQTYLNRIQLAKEEFVAAAVNSFVGMSYKLIVPDWDTFYKRPLHELRTDEIYNRMRNDYDSLFDTTEQRLEYYKKISDTILSCECIVNRVELNKKSILFRLAVTSVEEIETDDEYLQAIRTQALVRVGNVILAEANWYDMQNGDLGDCCVHCPNGGYISCCIPLHIWNA